MKKKKQYMWTSEDSSINLTPLLDVIFNLIFFFVLATTIKEHQAFIDLTLPDVQVAVTEQQEETPLIISISRDNEIFLNDERVSLATMGRRLEELSDTRERPVIVRGDAKSYHEVIVDVLDVCSQHDFNRIKIEVEKGATTTAPSSP